MRQLGWRRSSKDTPTRSVSWAGSPRARFATTTSRPRSLRSSDTPGSASRPNAGPLTGPTSGSRPSTASPASGVISYGTVRDYVANRRREIRIEAGRGLANAFVPQEHRLERRFRRGAGRRSASRCAAVSSAHPDPRAAIRRLPRGRGPAVTHVLGASCEAAARPTPALRYPTPCFRCSARFDIPARASRRIAANSSTRLWSMVVRVRPRPIGRTRPCPASFSPGCFVVPRRRSPWWRATP